MHEQLIIRLKQIWKTWNAYLLRLKMRSIEMTETKPSSEQQSSIQRGNGYANGVNGVKDEEMSRWHELTQFFFSSGDYTKSKISLCHLNHCIIIYYTMMINIFLLVTIVQYRPSLLVSHQLLQQFLQFNSFNSTYKSMCNIRG